jgi:hypothetical protein
MHSGPLRESQVVLLAQFHWPRHQLTGVVVRDQFAGRTPLVLDRDDMRDQEPPSIVCVHLNARRAGLVELPAGRPGLNGLGRHGKQLTALGVSQREGTGLEIENAEMAERRPPPHDVHD